MNPVARITPVKVGDRAPSFRLPSAQGPELGPDDYRGQRNLIVWITKGMACPFCRAKMSQLARGYPEIRARNTEVIQVTPTPVDRARFYAGKFTLPFPYLCDPDYRVHLEWGVGYRSHSLPWYAKTFYQAMKMPKPTTEFGDVSFAVKEVPALLADEDTGFFILDRAGVVRYANTGAYFGESGPRPVPDTAEIVRELERCEKG